MWKLLILTATTIAAPIYAQTCAQADAALAQAYTQMKEGGSHSYAGSANENQRDTAETRFHQTLSAYLQQSNSWACRFPRTTRAGIIIHTAPNGHLRSFSWDAQSGGTLREYHNLLQYRTPSGRSATQKGEGILTGIILRHTRPTRHCLFRHQHRQIQQYPLRAEPVGLADQQRRPAPAQHYPHQQSYQHALL